MSLTDIKIRVEAAEIAAGRSKKSTTLLAISKVQPNSRVRVTLEQGHLVFGENKVQEAAKKWPGFKQEFSNISVHLIGALQTNKVKQAVQIFDAIHTVDRLKLARKLADEIQVQGKNLELFIQVNTGEEPQKSGILPANTDQFIKDCLAMDLPISGLMVIPPVNEDPSLHFSLLRKLAIRNGLSGLSMGMSADFERAIALGATHIRVGSAIFGKRDYS